MNHIDTTVSRLQERTRISISYAPEIKQAFMLGLWWKEIPAELIGEIGGTYSYYSDTDFELLLVSETGSAWHESYRALRTLGWQRRSVKREGGIITYMLEIYDEEKPKPFQHATLKLTVSLQTCKAVQVGTKEVPVFETVCEDLAAPEGESLEENEEASSEEEIPF